MQLPHGFTPTKRWTVISLVLTCLLAASCEKPAPSGDARPAGPTIAIFTSDLKPDGSITDAGLKKVQAHAADLVITVAFVHCSVTDKGIAQLAAFPNIRRVEASGGEVTPAGAEKLKQAIPQVEVVR